MSSDSTPVGTDAEIEPRDAFETSLSPLSKRLSAVLSRFPRHPMVNVDFPLKTAEIAGELASVDVWTVSRRQKRRHRP